MRKRKHLPARGPLAAALAGAALLTGCAGLPRLGTARGPGDAVAFHLLGGGGGALFYSITRGEELVIAPSRLGVSAAGRDLGERVESATLVSRSDFHLGFPWRGRKSRVRISTTAYLYELGTPSGPWQLEIRVFPDGAAWSYLVPEPGEREVGGESTVFSLPPGAEYWAMSDTKAYEGLFHRRRVGPDREPEPSTPGGEGEYLALPLTFRLPGGNYGSILESSSPGWSGMALEELPGGAGFRAAFPGDPGGWTVPGPLRSSWRVVLTGPTLNALYNSDIVSALAEPPDPELFPRGALTPWCRPGKSAWAWWSLGTEGATRAGQEEFVDLSAELGFPYYLVDAGWEDPALGWMDPGGAGPWESLRGLCAYAAARGVAIWVWRSWQEDPQKHWGGLDTPGKREDFFRRARAAGAVGVKIDFIESESAGTLLQMRNCLDAAARQRLMVVFHGVAKPAGEERTWPNQMSREALRGLEYARRRKLPGRHFSQLLFTRYLAGPGDFTPVVLDSSGRGNTTPGYQLATGVLTDSPFLCLGGIPAAYLSSPALPFLRGLPASWDETRVLPGSAIGGKAGLIRRAGNEWWIGAINPGPGRSWPVRAGFLPPGKYRAEIFRDRDRQTAEIARRPVSPGSEIVLDLLPDGGAVVRILPEP